MDTTFWGDPAWTLLFCIALNYKNVPQNKDQYVQFFNLLQYVLPCGYCRDSFSKFSKVIPITNYLSSNKRLFYWVYLLRCHVSKKLRLQGEPKGPDPEFDEVWKRFTKKEANKRRLSCKRRRKSNGKSKMTSTAGKRKIISTAGKRKIISTTGKRKMISTAGKRKIISTAGKSNVNNEEVFVRI